MGNEILSLVKEDSNKLDDANVKRSIIHPIKYGYQRHSLQQNRDNKDGIQNKILMQESNIRIYEHPAHEMIGKRETNNGGIAKNIQMVRQQHQESDESYRQPDQIKYHFPVTKQQPSTSQLIKGDYRIPKSQSNIRKSELSETQIIIDFVPSVSRMISILKPFQHQLSLLDQRDVRKIKLGQSADIFKGQTNDVKQPHGFGMLIKQNGSTLIGKFEKGLIQGQSFFIYNNGSYYRGKMLNSMAHDSIGEFHSLQMSYIGGFLDNTFQGQCQQLGNDYYFKGYYENNLRKQGIFCWNPKQFNNDTVKQQLQKTNPYLNHQTVQTQKKYPQQEQQTQIPPIRDFSNIPKYHFTYQGSFDVHQLFTGKATLKDPQGTYSGDFYRGMKHGKGQYQYKSQIKYIGDYNSDQRSGYGVLFNSDNTLAYQGQWKDGLPSGKGQSYDIKGRKTQAVFINGLPRKIVPENQSFDK